MRDCSTCKHSAERRPELKDMPFEKTPCFKCRPSEPERSPNIISFGEQFDYPTEKTWKIIELGKEEYRMETFKYWLDAWSKLDSSDQKIIAILLQNQGKSQAMIARGLGVSRQAIHKRVKRIKKKFPGVFK